MAKRKWGDRPGPMAMVNAWGDWIVVAALAASGHTAWHTGRRRAGLGLLAGAGLQSLRALSWRPTIAAGPNLGTIRVLSANLLYRCPDPGGLLEHIARVEPDLVFLQELTPQVAARLESATGGRLGHRILAPRVDADGFGILSRYPLTGGDVLKLGVGNVYAMTATTEIHGQLVDLYNTHLVSPVDVAALREAGWRFSSLTGLRETQAQTLAAAVASGGRTAVIAGDFNASPGQRPVAIVASVARDAWRDAGRGLGATWPRRLVVDTPALLRLDYCFATDGLIATDATVLSAATGSDHSPLLVDYRFARRRSAAGTHTVQSQ